MNKKNENLSNRLTKWESLSKTAQKRTFLTKVHDNLNLPGKATEKFFNPEFQNLMDNLRSVDDNARSIVAGEAIDGGDSGSDSLSMKEMLKEAKKNFNRKEYMTVVSYLGRFHKKTVDLVEELDKLNFDVSKIHEDFLFKDLDDEHKEHLTNLKKRFSNRVYRESLFVDAGIKDTWHNLFNERGKALSTWEKKYPKQVKKIRKDTENILNKSEQILNLILSSLKVMGTARAARNPDNYLKEIGRVKGAQSKYHDLFVSYYNENIKGFLDNQAFTKPPEQSADLKEISDGDIPTLDEVIPDTVPDLAVRRTQDPSSMPLPLINKINTDVEELSPASEMTPEQIYNKIEKENIGSPRVPKQDFADVSNTLYSRQDKKPLKPEEVPTEPPPVVPDGLENIDEILPELVDSDKDSWGFGMNDERVAHKKFFQELVVISKESPLVIANFINKYAKSIEKTDSIISSRLKNLAKNLK